MKPYILGADIGGTAIKLGLFSREGELLGKRELPTRTGDGGAAVLPDVARAVREALEGRQIPAGQVAGIGVGVPGPVDEDGVVHKCVNLGWGVCDVREELGRLLPEIPLVRTENDANMAALGELWQGGGRGRGRRSAVMLTLGTGIGGGVVWNGRIVSGANGGAGEIGHMTVEPRETEPCSCGKRGCLEQYASASGIVRLARRMLAESRLPSALREMDGFTSRQICDLARQGEEMAGQIVDRCAEYLGRAMSYISCAIDPDLYIIGGGMSRAGQVLTGPILRYHRRYAVHVSAGTEIVTARLGNDAGIYGCARAILNEEDDL